MLNKHLIAQTRPVADPANIVRWKDMRITLLADALFRIEQSENMHFCDTATQIVWFRDAEQIRHTAELSETACIVKTAAAELHLTDSLEDSYILLADGRKASLSNEGIVSDIVMPGHLLFHHVQTFCPLIANGNDLRIIHSRTVADHVLAAANADYANTNFFHFERPLSRKDEYIIPYPENCCSREYCSAFS